MRNFINVSLFGAAIFMATLIGIVFGDHMAHAVDDRIVTTLSHEVKSCSAAFNACNQNLTECLSSPDDNSDSDMPEGSPLKRPHPGPEVNSNSKQEVNG